MTSPSALVIGEALVDEFPDRRVVAGAPLHVAAHLASLGWEVAMITRVGADEDGRRITQTLRQFGVNTSMVEVDSELPTGVTRIEMSGTDHSFDVVHPAAWDAITGPPDVPAVDAIYWGTLALRDSRTRAALNRIVSEAGGTVVVDLNLRTPYYDDERIRRAVALADILKLNEGELTVATSAFGRDPAIEALHDEGPEWICVTRGEKGAELSRVTGDRWAAPAPRVDVVDTVGAGDAFCAMLIDGLIRDRDPQMVIEAAVRRGTAIASQRGGLPEPP